MVASGVWAGGYSLEKAYSLMEVGGGKATQKSELERIGYLGTLEASHKAIPIGAQATETKISVKDKSECVLLVARFCKSESW